MKIRFVLPVFAALAFSSIANAQAAAPAKIGVISVQEAIASTQEGKAKAAELSTQFAPRQNELSSISKKIDDLNTQLRAGDSTLSDDAKAHIQTQITQLQQSYQRKGQDLQDDQQAAEQDVIEQIGRKLEVVLDKYAKDNGYAVILDVSSQQTSVFWAADAVNVTPQIIQLYDQANPAKAPAASTAPSSSAPRSTPPRPAGGTGATPKPQ